MKQVLGALVQSNVDKYLPRRIRMGVRAKLSLSGRPQHIAMYLGSELPAEVMDCVIETCVSRNNDLTVVTFESVKTVNALLQPYKDRLSAAGVGLRVKHLKGEPLKSLGRYLRKHPEINTLACKDSGYLGRSYVNNVLKKDAFPVPVMVVATNKAAA